MHVAVPEARLARQVRASDLLSRLEADPVVAAAVVVGLLVAILAGVLLVRWLRRPPGRELLSLLADLDRVTVLTHPNPDPDAMGSAAAVAHLAEQAGTSATIRYPGEIRHHQNRAFQTVLDLEMERLERVDEIVDDPVVLVDHNVARGFAGSEQVRPMAVVDHHPGDGAGRSFTDVREHYGACASILAEYLQQVDATLAGPEEAADAEGLVVPSEIVTGLTYGILSDTNHLIDGCSPAEFRAAAYLYPAIDRDRLNRVANPHVDAETLDVKARAIRDRMVETPYAVSDVATVGNVDAIPQAASELVNLETVAAVVVLGDADGTIHLSGRSRDDRVHMGRVLEQIAEDIPMATGGGHARMGGGQIDIQHMEGLGPGSGIDREVLHRRLFAAMQGTEYNEQAATAED